MCDARLSRGGDVVDLDTMVTVLRVFVGLVVAGHGAQKAFGWLGGTGLAGWTAGVAKMGLRPPGFWANAAAWGETVGGLMLAIGLLTGIAAGVLVVDMIVAIWKVHWIKGLWIANGGYEYAMTNAVIFGLFGLAGPGAYSVDAALRLESWTILLFATTLLIGLLGVWGATRPAAVERVEEERHRRVA
jgi:putative oxidoreductase